MSDVDYSKFFGPPPASNGVAGALDGNADQAGKSINLSRETNVPAAVIHADPQGFEADKKVSDAATYGQEPAIAGYLAQDPLHGEVSNDDYENLSNWTKAYKATLAGIFRAKAEGSALSNALARDKDGQLLPTEKADFAKQPELSDLLSPGAKLAPKILYQMGKSSPAMAGAMLGGTALGGAGSVAGPVGTAVGGVAGMALGGGAVSFAQAIAPHYQEALNGGASPDEALNRAVHRAAMDGTISGVGMGLFGWSPFQGAVKNILTQALVLQPGVESAGKVVNNLIEGNPALSGAGEGYVGTAIGTAVNPLMYFGMHGRTVPHGVDPTVERLRAEETKVDHENLDNLIEVTQASKTFERSPEAFAQFAKQHEEQTVSLPARAIAEVYKGGIAPRYGDHLFGYIPDLADRLPVALESGDHIDIPLADYVAFTDAKVHETVKNDLRIRQDGLSPNEVKDNKEAEAGADQAAEDSKFSIEKTEEGGVIKPKDVEASDEPDSEGTIATPGIHFAEDDKNITVQGSYIPPEARGKGLGTAMYKKLLDIAGSKKKTVLSDYDISADAYKTYQKLKQEGYNVEFAKGLHLGDDEGFPGKYIPGPEDTFTVRIEPKDEFTSLAQINEKGMYLHPLFVDAKAAGMTEADFARYSRKLEKREADLVDRATRAASREISRRQTTEWKDNEKTVRAQVDNDFRYDPTLMADRFLRTGDIPNDFLPKGTKLDAEAIDQKFGAGTAEQLPKGMTKKGGVHPDDIAAELGFNSGEGMVNRLLMLEAARRTKGETPTQYLERISREETAKRMEATHGDLGENIFNEAREAALDEVHVDILSDELKALAGQVGGDPPLTKDELVQWVSDTHKALPAKEARNVERFQRNVGAEGKNAERALLKGDPLEAFHAKQRQMLNFLRAKEAMKLDRLMDQTEKTITRFSRNQIVPSVDQAYTDQIHKVLDDIGWGNRHPVKDDLQPLKDFVADSDGQLAVAYWLQDGQKFNYDDLTAGQYQEFANSLKSLAHVGRNAKMIDGVMAKAELDNVIFDIKESLDRFNLVEQPLNKSVGQRVKSFGRWVAAAHVLPERIFDYTDKFDPHGPIASFLDRPLRDGQAKETTLSEKVQRDLRKMEDYTDSSVNDTIENNVFPDNLSKSGFLNLNRRNLRQIMLHMGNKSNIEKLTKGYGVEEESVRKLIADHATEKDWKWVQGIWDIFKDLKKEADAMQERVTGVPSETLPAQAINTGFGWHASGGYAPIVYDTKRSNIEGDIAKKGGLFDQNYFKATTPHGYTLPRTQYFAPLDLTGVMLPTKLQSVVHDIAFREPVLNAGKLIYNKSFNAAMTEKWGKEFTDVLQPWLKDIANVHNVDDSYARGASRIASLIRQNLTSTMIFWNPGTYMKHGGTAAGMSVERVGVKDFSGAAKDIGVVDAVKSARDLMRMRPAELPDPDFMQAFKDVTDPSDRGESQREFILASSAFMRKRQSSMQDTIRDAYNRASFSSGTQTFMNARAVSMNIGRFPVAFSDAVSAMPTWLAAYKKAALEGETHADAVFVADKEVSRAHGSSSVIDTPRVLRTGEAMRWVTPLYNFWNHMFNNQLQFAWDVGALVHGRDEPRANVGSLSNRIFWLAVVPIMMEEMAAPALSEDKHGLITQGFLATLRYLGGGIVGLRDLTNAVAGGYEPSVGMMGTMTKAMTNEARDVANATQAGKHISKDALTHLSATIGIATGLGGVQVGKTGTFLFGHEHPQNFAQFRQGIRTGHVQPPRH